MAVARLTPEFSVAQLGTIQTGCLQPRPLTLLCGANNTGKTWVMYALYGFLRQPLFRPLDLAVLGLSRLDQQLREEGSSTLDVVQWLGQYHAAILQTLHRSMQQRLPAIFNSLPDLFRDSGFAWLADRESMCDSAKARALQFSLSIGQQGKAALTIDKPEDSAVITLTLAGTPLYDAQDVATVLLEHVIGKPAKQNVFLLPAERNGLHLFFRELRNLRSAQTRTEPVSPYAEPLADYLGWLNNLGRLEATGIHALRKLARKASAAGADHDALIGQIADDLRSLAGGHYAVDPESNIRFTPATGGTAPVLDLHLTSSTVKTLFGLWYFLRHEAQSGDVLMIDEPELNLHPHNQRLVARILVRLVNAGLTVICSTHSDYIVREINSLILLSRPHPERASLLQQYRLQESETLPMDAVSAYSFGSNGFAPMRISQSEGILATTFDQVIRDLNDSSDDIYYRYLDGA